MTDKELDNKLTAAFDNVRADSAVKARIRKGLAGDIIMENKTISISNTDNNKVTGTAKVRRRGRIAAAAIAGVLAVGGGVYLLKDGYDRVDPGSSLSAAEDGTSPLGSYASIPDVAGMDAADAESALREAGYTVILRTQYDLTVPEGKAIGAELIEGTEDEVELLISAGKTKVKVPDVSGYESDAAESELKAAGFAVMLRSKYDDKVPEGQAIGTDPAAGTEFAADDMVTLYISKGPLDTQVKVPDVVGLTKERATNILEYNNLKVKVLEMPHDGDKGKVIDQSIEGGRRVDRDSEVNIYVSTGESDPVDLTVSLPMPEGLNGPYAVDVYKDGNVVYQKAILKGEAYAGRTIDLDISGKKTETLTVNIRSDETGKSVDYAVFNVNYDKKTAELAGRLDTEGLLAINSPKSETSNSNNNGEDDNIGISKSVDASSELTISLPVPEGLRGSYNVDVFKEGNLISNQHIANGASVAGGSITMDISGKKIETLSVKITSEDTGKSVDYAVFNVNFVNKTAELVGRLDKDGLLAITPKN